MHNQGYVWAVVDTGTRKLFGRISCDDGCLPTRMEEALEVYTSVPTFPLPDGRGGVGVMKLAPALDLIPLEGEMEPVAVRFDMACMVRTTDEMRDKGKALFAARDRALDMLQRLRAAESNIVAPGGSGLIHGA